ncbi:hypothetical protein CCUS01_09993 [Colletotrichum cuscutae]|uniref:Uncharacterized protein n=1 Tax=Colletotrichum cuscutae TaxID=1209917 RepID=A0AAI9UGD6_9PEZI|nr:hypothetical protein CCUS01_09993 [Colletotrichum cuscutae]
MATPRVVRPLHPTPSFVVLRGLPRESDCTYFTNDIATDPFVGSNIHLTSSAYLSSLISDLKLIFCSGEVPETPSSPVDSESEDEAPGSSDGSREATEKPPPDLASLAAPGFFKNLGAHPNLKGLPGLDFEIPFASPILGMKYSGLIGHMLLPYYDKRANYTHSRLVHVGERIKQVMVIAIRVFEDNPKMNTLRDLYEETFKVLREVDASWDQRLYPNKQIKYEVHI